MLKVLSFTLAVSGFCDGVSRCNFLHIGGLGGFVLPKLLRVEVESGIRSEGHQAIKELV